MPFKFETLQIWQKAFELSDDIHKLALTFPKIELFNLTTQIKRAADSVVLNIAEGCTGSSNAEFHRFLNIALRSAIETVSCLMLAKRRSYISKEEYQNKYEQYDHLCRMITKFRNSIP